VVCRQSRPEAVRALKGKQVQVAHAWPNRCAARRRRRSFAPGREFWMGLISHYAWMTAAGGGARRDERRDAGARLGQGRDFASTGDTGETEIWTAVRLTGRPNMRRRCVLWAHAGAEPNALTARSTSTRLCVRGRLTALRYPEREWVSVPAARTYWSRPAPEAEDSPGPLGQQQTTTSWSSKTCWASASFDAPAPQHHHPRGDATAAWKDERFAANPSGSSICRPTMFRRDVQQPGLLEHPGGFAYYRTGGVAGGVRGEAYGVAGRGGGVP